MFCQLTKVMQPPEWEHLLTAEREAIARARDHFPARFADAQRPGGGPDALAG